MLFSNLGLVSVFFDWYGLHFVFTFRVLFGLVWFSFSVVGFACVC